MIELDFRNAFLEEENDNPDYDKFATQFTRSLLLETREGDEPIYWHGRLIGLGDVDGNNIWEPYKVEILGAAFGEKVFRHKLESDEITISRFEIIGAPDYHTDENPSRTHLDQTTVTYRAALTAVINGREINQEVIVTQKIRRTYLAYDTRITPA